jgi:hypothetical protein
VNRCRPSHARQAIREYAENHSRAELMDRVLDEELLAGPKARAGAAIGLSKGRYGRARLKAGH